MITPPIDTLRQVVVRSFPGVKDLGVYNRRPIRGTSVWSQHAWGNAWDIGGPVELLDQVHHWLIANRATMRLGTILWRVRDHYDHIHVEGLPKQIGTPPPVGGSIKEDEMELAKAIQQALITAGYPLPQYGADGKWGPESQAALVAALRAGGLPPHSHKGSVTVT